MGTPGRQIRQTVGRLAPPGTRRRSALAGLVDRRQAQENAAYQAWIAACEEESAAPPADPAEGPLFSIVVPAFNTPDRYLRALVASILTQSYPRWELCLVDGSTETSRSQSIKALAGTDDRIRLIHLEGNRGIAGNTNAGIEAARGDYLAFLDHDDTLAPFALNEVAAALAKDPTLDLFYSDEDKLSNDGRRRSRPFFKPGWSPELFLCANYLAHFVVAGADLVRAVGAIRSGFEGAQDYDLLLRLLDHRPRIHHVARVSYHWRMAEGSTARTPGTKAEAQESGRRALSDYLGRQQIAATVEPFSPEATSYRIRYALRGPPGVHLVLTEHGPSLAALQDATDGHRLAECSGASTLASLAGDDLLLIVAGPGQPAEPGWLQELASVAALPGVGVVGAALQDGEGRGAGMGYAAAGGSLSAQLAGEEIDRWTAAGWGGWPRDVIAAGGCGVLTVGLARELVAAGTGFDLVSLSLAAHRKGLRNVWWPFARFITGTTLPAVRLDEPIEDPYRNPNLTPDGRLRDPAQPARPPVVIRPGAEHRGESGPSAAVSFVVVSWNSRDRIDGAVRSVTSQGARAIVVDNASGDGTAEHIRTEHPDVTLIDAGANLGFPAAANLGIREALTDPGCRYVGLLNDDAWLGDGWLRTVLSFAEQHREGAGFQTVTVDAGDPEVVDSIGLTVGHAGRAIQLGYRARGLAVHTGEVFGVNAAAALYRRAFFEAQPFGDEVLDAGLGMYLEDVDLALRSVLLGWRNYVVEGALAYHLGSGGGRERRPATVRLNSRNEVLVAVKNLPWGLVARIVPAMVHAELARLRDYAADGDRAAIGAVLAGRLSALALLPLFLRKRAALAPYRRLSSRALWERMAPEFPQPVPIAPARPPRGALQDLHPALQAEARATNPATVTTPPPPADATARRKPPPADIRAVVVHYGTPELASGCVASLLAEGVAVTVIDNASPVAAWQELRRRCEPWIDGGVHGTVAGEEPRVNLLRLETNRGFGPGANAGVRALGPDFRGLVWLVNPDMRAEPGAAAALAASVADGQLDIASPAIYQGDSDHRRIYFTGGSLDINRVEADHWDYGLPFVPERGTVRCSYAAGASLLLARDTWDLLGGFPEDLFLYWEDAALSFRAEALGLRIGVVRESRMWHAVGASTAAAGPGASRSTYYYTCRNRFLVSKPWGVSLVDLLARRAAGPTYRWPLRALLRERGDRWGRCLAALRGTADGAVQRLRPGRRSSGRGPY